MAWSTSAGHAGDDLKRLAESRGIRLDKVDVIRCVECGAYGDAGPVLAFGLGHWPDCEGEDARIRFTRRRNDP